MKIARPTQSDVDVCQDLRRLIDAVEQDSIPIGNDAFAEFDPDNADDLRAFFNQVLDISRRRPGALARVVDGMDTLLFNNVLNSDVPHLALHQRYVDTTQPIQPQQPKSEYERIVY